MTEPSRRSQRDFAGGGYEEVRRRPPPPPRGPIARVPVSALTRVVPLLPGDPPPGTRSGFGLPNLRRNVCPHFYMTGTRGAIPIQAPHLVKGLMRQETTVSRCQLRGGVHLETSYVSDVCLSSRFNQCVFYEDELSRR